MFDKGLLDIEELERLEDLKKVQGVEQSVAKVTITNELFNPSILSQPYLDQLEGFMPKTQLTS